MLAAARRAAPKVTGIAPISPRSSPTSRVPAP